MTSQAEQALSAMKRSDISPVRGLYIHGRHLAIITELLELKVQLEREEHASKTNRSHG